MAKDNDGLFASNYVAAFMDVLGQQDRLRSFIVMPDTDDPDQREKFLAALKETLGVIVDLHDSCSSFFDAFEKESLRGTVPPDRQKIYENMCKSHIGFQRFSDGIVGFVSLADSVVKCPVKGIFGLLAACGMVCLRGLAGKHPVRAGIELGWGVELRPNELYGAVIPKAYHMESEVAQYPRAAVGDDLVAYLRSFQDAREDGIYTQFNGVLATMCLDLLSVDTDGIVFVDYLGVGFKKHVAAELDSAVVKAAFEFVVDQCVFWGRRRNTKLVSRYLMLRDYFTCRWPLWVPGEELSNKRGGDGL